MPHVDQAGQTTQDPPANGGAPPPANGQSGGDQQQPDINTLVNAAVTAQLRRALTPEKLASTIEGVVGQVLEKSLPGAFQAALGPVQEQLAKLAPAAPPPGQAGDKSKASSASPEPHPEIEALKKSHAALEEKLKAEQHRSAAEARKRLETQGHATARAALTGKVLPDVTDFVLDGLRARGALVISDDGTPQLRVRVAPAAGLPEEDAVLPFEQALPHWLKTKEAAAFQPPPKDPPRRGPPPAGYGPPGARGQPDFDSAYETRTGRRLEEDL